MVGTTSRQQFTEACSGPLVVNISPGGLYLPVCGLGVAVHSKRHQQVTRPILFRANEAIFFTQPRCTYVTSRILNGRIKWGRRVIMYVPHRSSYMTLRRMQVARLRLRLMQVVWGLNLKPNPYSTNTQIPNTQIPNTQIRQIAFMSHAGRLGLGVAEPKA